ncbi:MAG: tRNA (5-methylaminomethyl-2-thiouridine)(34)-methyltransferase MnmD [Dysgonomonas sp.]
MSSMNVWIEHTADGSDTLYVPKLDEHYHSVNGAIQESNHIFINAGLNVKLQQSTPLSILEIGFGTGLNALLTQQIADQKKLLVNYTSLELYPLSMYIVEKLNYPALLGVSEYSVFMDIHQAEWGRSVKISPYFELKKIETDFSKLDFNAARQFFDLIYFDAFAPDKQQEMWTQDIFNYLFSVTKQNGIFVTYCAKGIVRRMLQQAGYVVERLQGPPGKREMLRAIRCQ